MHGCVSFRPGQVLCLRSATTSFWHSDAVRGPSTPTWIPMLSLGVASPPTKANDWPYGKSSTVRLAMAGLGERASYQQHAMGTLLVVTVLLGVLGLPVAVWLDLQ